MALWASPITAQMVHGYIPKIGYVFCVVLGYDSAVIPMIVFRLSLSIYFLVQRLIIKIIQYIHKNI